MSTWYIATWPESPSMARIEPVEILKSTSASVFVDGRRCAKHNSYEHYYETRAEAVACILEAQRGKIAYYEAQIEAHKQTLSIFEADHATKEGQG